MGINSRLGENVKMASSPSDDSDHGNHVLGKKHLWGGIGIGILTVLLVASLYYLFRKKLLPALRRRQSPLIKIRKGTPFIYIYIYMYVFVYVHI